MNLLKTITIFCFLVFGNLSNAQIRHLDMYGNGIRDSQKMWNNYEKCCSYSIVKVDSVIKHVKGAIRVELRRLEDSASVGKRAELVDIHEDSLNIERWYSFKVYIPNSFQPDSLREIIAQWHAMPDFSLGETWRSPPISLQTFLDNWEFSIKWATLKVNSNTTISGQKNIFIGKIIKDQWISFLFHIKFSYKDNGICQIWKNGKLILNYSGPNYYNDSDGPYFKLGIYKWEWNNRNINTKIDKRILYFSSVKVGNQFSTKRKMLKF